MLPVSVRASSCLLWGTCVSSYQHHPQRSGNPRRHHIENAFHLECDRVPPLRFDDRQRSPCSAGDERTIHPSTNATPAVLLESANALVGPNACSTRKGNVRSPNLVRRNREHRRFRQTTRLAVAAGAPSHRVCIPRPCADRTNHGTHHRFRAAAFPSPESTSPHGHDPRRNERRERPVHHRTRFRPAPTRSKPGGSATRRFGREGIVVTAGQATTVDFKVRPPRCTFRKR